MPLKEFRALFDPAVIIEPDATKTLTIHESDNGAKLKNVCIQHAPEDTFAVKLDAGTFTDYFNSKIKGIDKGVDAVLVK